MTFREKPAEYKVTNVGRQSTNASPTKTINKELLARTQKGIQQKRERAYPNNTR
jgi:hypothetical protein